MAVHTPLLDTLRRCEQTSEQERLPLGEVLRRAEISGFPFILTLLSLPFLQPISLGPLATVGGLTFCVIGWQMMRGYPAVELPRRIALIPVGGKTWKRILSFGIRFIAFMTRISSPRLGILLGGQHSHVVIGGLSCVGGLLIAVPWIGVPFNNTLPALTVFFAALASVHKDGLFVLISLFFVAVTLLYFTFLTYLLLFAGKEAFDAVVTLLS